MESKSNIKLQKNKSVNTFQRSLSRPHIRTQNTSKAMKINFNPDPYFNIEDKIKKVSIKGGTK